MFLSIYIKEKGGGYILLINERHQKILEILQKEKTVSTKKIQESLYISEATVRRDLTKMEQKGLIKRTYGGATIVESLSDESSFIIREQTQIKEKKKIALKAMDFIQDNTSYFLDSSSTVSHLLYYFPHFKDLTVVTNSFNNAMILLQNHNSKIYFTPGLAYSKTNCVLGADSLDYIRKFNCDYFFFSCSGLSLNQGVTEASFEQSLIKKEMLLNSKTHILLADHTKFNKIFLCGSCNFDDIDYIITDKEPDDNYLKVFNKANIKLVIA